MAIIRQLRNLKAEDWCTASYTGAGNWALLEMAGTAMTSPSVLVVIFYLVFWQRDGGRHRLRMEKSGPFSTDCATQGQVHGLTAVISSLIHLQGWVLWQINTSKSFSRQGWPPVLRRLGPSEGCCKHAVFALDESARRWCTATEESDSFRPFRCRWARRSCRNWLPAGEPQQSLHTRHTAKPAEIRTSAYAQSTTSFVSCHNSCIKSYTRDSQQWQELLTVAQFYHSRDGDTKEPSPK